MSLQNNAIVLQADKVRSCPNEDQNYASNNSLVVTRPATRWFKEEDWTRHRTEISTMYTRDHLPLLAVQRFMRDHYGLRATEKMFKDHFKAWNISKKLQPEEVEALLRVKAHLTSVGDPVHVRFSRYGKPISLERYLRDHPRLHEKLRQTPSDKSMVDDLVERYLPSRGLVVLESPQRYLRGEEGLHLTEVAIYSLQSFRATECSWEISGRNLSITWIRMATWKQSGVMAELQCHRDAAWGGIKRGCQLLQMDMKRNPGGFALDTLWLFASFAGEGEVLHLACQLAKHILLLSDLVLGAQNPYHNLFMGLFRFMQASISTETPSFKDFHTRISEVLLDIIIARIHAGSRDGTWSNTMSLMYEVVAPSTQERTKAALYFLANAKCSIHDFISVALTLIQIRFREKDYQAGYALYRAIRARDGNIKGDTSDVLKVLELCGLSGDWQHFGRAADLVVIGLDPLMKILPSG